MAGFATTFVHYSIAGILALVLIVLAVNLPKQISFKSISETPSYLFAGTVAFTGSATWLILFLLLFKQGAGIPLWTIELTGILIVIILYWLITEWIKRNWNNHHSFSLAFGGLMASMLFGLITLVQSGNQLDIICQLIFILMTTGLMILLKKRLLKSKAQ